VGVFTLGEEIEGGNMTHLVEDTYNAGQTVPVGDGSEIRDRNSYISEAEKRISDDTKENIIRKIKYALELKHKAEEYISKLDKVIEEYASGNLNVNFPYLDGV